MFSMDKQRRINFYNFKYRQYKNQPYVIELNLFGKSFVFYFYPPILNVYPYSPNTWDNLYEDDPF